jgi:hypothetical protein
MTMSNSTRLILSDHGFTLYASARATYDWAHTPGALWPCSTLAGRRLRAEFDRNGLCDLTINGAGPDCGPPVDVDEFNAFVADTIAGKLPADHPCRVFFPPEPEAR